MKYFFLMLLVACSSPVSKKISANYRPLIREIRKESFQASHHSITNRHNYLAALFEQSLDPYYGTKRWSPECLAANQVGFIQSNEQGIYLVSKLLLNPNGEPGYCEGTSTFVAYYRCTDEDALKEARQLDNGPEVANFWTQLCP